MYDGEHLSVAHRYFGCKILFDPATIPHSALFWAQEFHRKLKSGNY